MAKAGNILGIRLGVAALAYLCGKAYNIKEAVKKRSVSNPQITANPNIKGHNILEDISLQILNPGSVNIPFEYYTDTIVYDTTKMADFNFNGNDTAIAVKSTQQNPAGFSGKYYQP